MRTAAEYSITHGVGHIMMFFGKLLVSVAVTLFAYLLATGLVEFEEALYSPMSPVLVLILLHRCLSWLVTLLVPSSWTFSQSHLILSCSATLFNWTSSKASHTLALLNSRKSWIHTEIDHFASFFDPSRLKFTFRLLLYLIILMKQTTTQFDFAAKPKVTSVKPKYRE